jgi:hypothetical protein
VQFSSASIAQPGMGPLFAPFAKGREAQGPDFPRPVAQTMAPRWEMRRSGAGGDKAHFSQRTREMGHPQRLKPIVCGIPSGTAKAVPFHKTIHETS